jgi:hypothetical protein
MRLIATLAAGGRIDSIESDAASALPLTSSGGTCPIARGRLVEERSTVTNLAGTSSISITLI